MSTPAPLRPGPADPDAADRIRQRILDAATECLLAEGLDGRLHATIAEQAGVSRPTVYKYVGDQAAILDAVLERELERFFEAVLPVLRTSDDLEAHLVDGVVFVVDYAREHELLQKALREHPTLILPPLTTAAEPFMERVVELFEQQLGRALHQAGASEVSARTAVEWLFRIVTSLITTPTPAAAGDRLRGYVTDLVRLMRLSHRDR